jgi:glycerol-3-phosphate dehydrogenase
MTGCTFPFMARSWRDEARDRLTGGTFDVLVIGGGINGAGVARDAAQRGL